MADLVKLVGPVTVANLTAAAGVTTTVDGWWPCLDITFRTPVPASITKITAQVRERGADGRYSQPAETVLTKDEIAAGAAKIVNGVSVGQHLEVRLSPAGAPGLPFQPTPWLEVTTSWDALMASLDGLLVGCVKIVCGEGEPTRTDLPIGSLYVEEGGGQLWQYVADKEIAVSAVNIAGTSMTNTGGANTATLTGFDPDHTVRFSKPLAADSGGLLTWDAYSLWPSDGSTSPPPPVTGQTWLNKFTVYGNNGGSDVLLETIDASNGGNFYVNSAAAYAGADALLPVTVTGYATYKVVGWNDPNPADNRNGLSVLVEEIIPGWVKKSDLTSIQGGGVEVEASPRSVNFVGATVTTDDEHNVTVTIAGSPGGSSGQIQYNNAGAFAGFTMSGDGTLNTGTGALTVTKTNGVSFGAFATGTDAANLTGTVSVNRFNSGTGASSSTFLRGDGTWATPSGGSGTVTHTTGALASGQLIVGNGSADIKVGDLSGDVTTSGGTATTLATSGVSAGTYGSSSLVPVITFDAKGRATAATTASISGTVPGAGGLVGVQVITATGAGTHTPTAGTNFIIIELQAAGGGGAGSASPGGTSVGYCVGGSSGGYVRKRLTANFSGASYSVGAKGTGGAAGNNAGSNGGNTTFTTTGGSPVTYTAGGGQGGGRFTSAAVAVAGSATGGTATGGDVNIPGVGGAAAFAVSTNSVVSGSGGISQFSKGAAPAAITGSANAAAAGNSASGFGGGGSGVAICGSGTAQAGGNGSDGVIIIWEYS